MEALVIAIQANIQHGKPLSRSERQEAARAVLRTLPRPFGPVGGRGLRSVAFDGGRVAPFGQRGRSEGKDRARRPAPPGRPHL